MADEVLPEQVQIRLVPGQDQLDAQPLVGAGDGTAEPVAEQGEGSGMQHQLQRLAHGGEICRCVALHRAPGHPPLLGFIQLTGRAPLRLPLAQGQAPPRLAIALPA
ncbi:hypothetical protein D3C78_1325760 [compost metagenome]